jgi:hypothetical protein
MTLSLDPLIASLWRPQLKQRLLLMVLDVRNKLFHKMKAVES